jgi:Holliday junction resolvase RusA-like endonuclease
LPISYGEKPVNVFATSLPLPPSVNALFATDFKTKRRFVSKDYAMWKRSAAGLLFEAWHKAGRPKFDKHLSLTIHAGLSYRRDVDGCVKAIADALVQNIPGFPDDRYIDRLEVERVPGMDGCRIMVQQIGKVDLQQV